MWIFGKQMEASDTLKINEPVSDCDDCMSEI